MSPYVLGIDVGTGGTRALIIGADGKILASATEEHEPFASPQIGWAEQRPEDWWRAAAAATRTAISAAKLMLDVADRKWSDEVLKAAQIDKSLLPSLHESPDVCGKVNAAGAEATGLAIGTPVVAGAGDQAAGATGMGIVKSGAVSATIGTSGVVFAATDRPALDARGRLHTFCHAVPGRWHVMGVTQSAGLSLRWSRDHLAGNLASKPGVDPYDILTAEAAATPAGADGLLWTPYLM